MVSEFNDPTQGDYEAIDDSNESSINLEREKVPWDVQPIEERLAKIKREALKHGPRCVQCGYPIVQGDFCGTNCYLDWVKWCKPLAYPIYTLSFTAEAN